LDLARTRRETYLRPGALPDVEPASLTEDLSRRDFTVNAMALQLTLNAGQLIDPFGGQRDLEAGLIRVLHEASFQDDATRMLRAARYAARLGFSLDEATATWLRRDLSYVDAITPARVRRELELLCKEPTAVDAALTAESLGVLHAIDECLSVDNFGAKRWREALIGQHFAPVDEFGLCMMTGARFQAQVDDLHHRLHLSRTQETALRDYVELVSSPLAGLNSLSPDALSLDTSLAGRSLAAIWAAAYSSDHTNEACLLYLSKWRHLRPHLRGDDLIALGVSPGPPVGEMLKTLRAALLRGLIKTREDETELVKRELGVVGG
jgi:tRNA nucleotidyltransferase (CCA-adding enzyme)